MMPYVYVALGGAMGAIFRFITMQMVGSVAGKEFPFATLAVNVLGGFLLGVLVEYLALVSDQAKTLHPLLAIGVLGGFTTFSTFTLDMWVLIQRGEYISVTLYMLLSVAGALIAMLAGMACARAVFV